MFQILDADQNNPVSSDYDFTEQGLNQRIDQI